MLRRLVAPLLAAGVIAGTALIGAPAAAATTPTAGCAPSSGAIPAGAATASIPDIDGDGLRDTEYYTEYLPDGGGFDYGIRTASGHLARIHETMRGPGDHGGWTARIVHGTVITVIDDHRSAKLYSFRGCSFHAVRNAQGHQYTFGIAGYTGPGTGVACVVRNGMPWLFGEQATRRPDQRWDVIRTHVVVTRSGSSARNGVIEKVGSDLANASKQVQTAFVSSCGSVTRVHNSGR